MPLAPRNHAPEREAEFTTTRWSMVWSSAIPECREAREQFARMYWYPLYVFARRTGASPDDAADAVQTFLSRLLESGSLADVNHQCGRFRNFLRTGVANQLRSNHRAQNSARRRPPGGFVCPDGHDSETRLSLEPLDHRSPESAYDHCCARALLEAAWQRLHREYSVQGRERIFEHLAKYLDGDPPSDGHAAAAVELGIAEGSLRNMTAPFRKRFAELFRQQVAATVDDPAQIEDELRSLAKALQA